jgi:hypothetical protein
MQSLLNLEVVRSEQSARRAPRDWEVDRPPQPPPRRRLRRGLAHGLAGLATRVDGDGARRALAR